MPTKVSAEKLLARHLGQEGATVVLTKIDKMIAEGESTAAIEKAVSEDISAHFENIVVQALLVKIGPLEPIRIGPVSAGVKQAIKPIQVIQINTGMSIKVDPGPMVGGVR